MERRSLKITLAAAIGVLALCLLGPGAASQAPEEAPAFWAVSIGLSHFANLPKADWLQFADADAVAFRQFVTSPRGRGFAEKNALLMINEEAGHQALRTRLADTLPKRVKPTDTVYIFVATHGVVEGEPANEGYLLGYDSDRENLYSTSLRMQELAYILQTRIRAKRIFLFADACRSGKLGQSINTYFADLSRRRTETMVLLASRPGELSREGPQYSGHGAFTYSLLKGLLGEADANTDKTVTVSELVSYLQTQLPALTENQQHIRELGDYDAETPMSFPDRAPPADLKLTSRAPLWPAFRTPLAGLQVQVSAEDQLRQAFDSALQQGNLLGAQDSAWSVYERSQQVQGVEGLRDELRDDLLIALATTGEKTIRAYRRGDQDVSLGAAEYQRAASLFDYASRLEPEDREHRAKARFLAGRALVARNRFPEAIRLLQESIALDPRTAYAYNALGIAYMEQSQWNEAIRNFREALARADKWIYPRANLARVYVALRRYDEAEREFTRGLQLGAELGVTYSYLHYNLGMLYLDQRRTVEALEQFRKAVEANNSDFRSYYHLGLIEEEQGRQAAAEQSFRKAVTANPGFAEAWLRLAALHHRQRHFEEEERALREAAAANPGHAGIVESLARHLMERGAAADAEQIALGLVMQAPDSATPFALLGDIHASQKKFEQAAEDYRQALARAADEKTRDSLRKRLEKLRK